MAAASTERRPSRGNKTNRRSAAPGSQRQQRQQWVPIVRIIYMGNGYHNAAGVGLLYGVYITSRTERRKWFKYIWQRKRGEEL